MYNGTKTIGNCPNVKYFVLLNVLMLWVFLAGVFNMVNGDGMALRKLLSAHPDIEVVSFTGSTRAGVLISKAAAETVKTVSLELGGKIAKSGVRRLRCNCRQLHVVPLFVSIILGNRVTRHHACWSKRSAYEQGDIEAASATAATTVDLPSKPGNHIGPLVSEAQFNKVQGLIQSGIDEGARLVAAAS